MTTETKKTDTKGMAPGVCVPWEEKLKDFTEIAGDAEMVKNEWEKLDAFAYVYVWWWVHR